MAAALQPLEAAQLAAANETMNAIDSVIASAPQVECPVVNRFTPGLYSREIFMPAVDEHGLILTSKIHKTEHQFVILEGEVSVWMPDTGWVRYTAPCVGITKPGTRRLLHIHKDTRWITFHPTTETDMKKLEAELIHPHEITPLPIEGGAK